MARWRDSGLNTLTIDGDSPPSMNSWNGIITEFTALHDSKSGENPHNAFIRKALA